MDKKLNEVTKVTDMAYVPVIMADGSIGQIAKSDLASVVAEYIPFGTSPKSVILLSDLDNIVETGMYTLHDGANELYGIALVYKAPGYSVIQFACAASTIKYRRSALGVTDNLQGREWIQLL